MNYLDLDNYEKGKTLGFGIGAILIILLVLLAPIIVFWVCYFLGFISKFVIGDTLIAGINTILKLNLSKDSLPLIAGALGWIGTMLKGINYNAGMSYHTK